MLRICLKCWYELEIVCSSKKPQNRVNKCPTVVRGQDGIKDDTCSDKTQMLKYSEGGTWTCLTSRCLRDWNLSILCQSGDVRALPSGKYISLSSSRNVLFLKCQRMVSYPVIYLWKKKKKIQTGFLQMSFNMEYLKSPWNQNRVSLFLYWILQHLLYMIYLWIVLLISLKSQYVIFAAGGRIFKINK